MLNLIKNVAVLFMLSLFLGVFCYFSFNILLSEYAESKNPFLISGSLFLVYLSFHYVNKYIKTPIEMPKF